MRRHRSFSFALIAAAILLAAGFILGGGASSAQDMASPTPGEESHPAHIHLGTCDELGEVVFPLNDLTHMDGTATPMADVAMVASPEPGPSPEAWSETDVQAGLDDIISGGHAINVHESMENIANYIACGEISGTAPGGELEIQLEELNDSGYAGRATLTDNGDGTTTVVVELFMADEMATPVPSPTT